MKRAAQTILVGNQLKKNTSLPREWSRPELPHIDPRVDSLVFQQFEIDYAVAPTPKDLSLGTTGWGAVIRCYGVTKEGNSVLCLIHGFLPYFYVKAPPGFSKEHCNSFKAALNNEVALKAKPDNFSRNDKSDKQPILLVEIVQSQSIMGYSETQSDFIKITTRLPKSVPVARAVLEGGFRFSGFPVRCYPTFESNIVFTLRYMIDAKMVGCGWIEIPPMKYTVKNGDDKISKCQIEVDVNFKDVVCHEAEGKWSENSKFRVLSFDIECAGRKGHFPEPEVDPVIQIANVVKVFGEEKYIATNVFNLRGCSNIAGTDVRCFSTEKELLLAWSEFINAIDPDLFTGYNISVFDFPYLMNRAKALGIQEEFSGFGRLRKKNAYIRATTFSSKAYGTRESFELHADGRFQFDMIQVMQREHKLRSYSLNAVCAEFLGEQKEDVHHSHITGLFNGSDDDRRRLAVYCRKDALLPMRLLEKKMTMFNYIEMSRVTGVPMSYLLSKGQQIKVVSQLYRKANSRGLLIPTYEPTGGGSDEVGYEGATVIEPKKGFYTLPIATLDFASLYPSIMIAHNLCYSTLVTNSSPEVSPGLVTKTPVNASFVKTEVKKGVLPEILEELLSARKKAKADLKAEKDPYKKAVLDGRQLALKVSANSVYGFTGATIGRLPCLEISGSVTAFGREMIEFTARWVESHYNIASGYPFDSEVIYGDTDSVMIKFGTKDRAQAMKWGLEAAEAISDEFIKPIKLEFEKVYDPYLLISKKRYAGLFFTKPDKWDRLDTKGLESVRRDNCPLVKFVITTVLRMLLIDRNVEGAISYVQDMVGKLVRNELDMSLLVITKAFSKPEYVNPQAHTELVKKMHDRDPLTAPSIGDRVPYVMVKAVKGSKGFEQSEDPLYALENNLPLDWNYYLEKQLEKPLGRIFEPIIGDITRLLHGPHTASIVTPVPRGNAMKGTLLAFASKQARCLACKAVLPSSLGDVPVCRSCESKRSEIYQQKLAKHNELEATFNKTWTQCQACQGSVTQEILCASRDCPIFYMRTKAQVDLNENQKTLQRFYKGDLSW